jgi:hypothetical protein
VCRASGLTLLVTLGCGMCATGAIAQQADPGAPAPLELTRLTTPIRFDGMPDEAVWQEVPALPLTMYAPVFRGEPEQRTEIRVAYDDSYFYAAGWFYDDDPDGIRVNSLYRDRWNGDDAFAIYIDSFNDDQNARWFGTTPSGMRFDLLVSDDGQTLNGNWDAFWESRTHRTPQGWFAEVRIPFSTLGFQVDDAGRAVMGLTVTRLVSRSGERVTFPAIDPKFLFRQPSVARDVVLRDVESSTPLYVTPYALVSDGSQDAGLDVRYPLSNSLNLDLTLNTDFAQVEADDQQVNLDRFPLFFPEKRRFFQEGSGVFEFTTGGGSRLFHSRRIGLTEDRLPVPVIGGARLVGRAGEWDVGLLSMQTAESGDTPTENFGVARLRRRVFNANSYVGAMATSRVRDGAHNVAGGLDAVIRMFGDDYLTMKWAASVDEADSAGLGLLERSHLYARWQRRANRGLAYTLSSTISGSEFRPDLGFLPRRDYWTANVLAERYFWTDDHSWLRRIWPGMLAFSTFRRSDGALESGQYAVWVQWETKRGGGGWIEPKLFRESVVSAFLIGGEAEVPAGDYTFADLQVNLSMANGRKLRTGVDFRAGSYFDGSRVQVQLTPTWNLSRHLEIGGEYLYSRIRFPDRGQGADIHLAGLRLRTALDARASGNALVQYNSTTDRLEFNVRLRYNFAEGTDLWLVFNEGLDAPSRSAAPGLEDTTGSGSGSLILKYSHTLGL